MNVDPITSMRVDLKIRPSRGVQRFLVRSCEDASSDTSFRSPLFKPNASSIEDTDKSPIVAIVLLGNGNCEALESGNAFLWNKKWAWKRYLNKNDRFKHIIILYKLQSQRFYDELNYLTFRFLEVIQSFFVFSNTLSRWKRIDLILYVVVDFILFPEVQVFILVTS